MTRSSATTVMRLLGPLVLVLLSSCRAGGYLGDRTLDFLDQYRFAAGAGTMAGVRVKSWGVVDTGLLVGVKPKATAIGWRYGAPLFLDKNERRVDANQAQIVTTSHAIGLDIEDGSYVSAWNSLALFPAIFTWADATPTDFTWDVPAEGGVFEAGSWLWSRANFQGNRYAQIHAFDVEFEIGLGLYLDVGFSPGEILDFWLGWFLIDIADDDGRV